MNIRHQTNDNESLMIIIHVNDTVKPKISELSYSTLQLLSLRRTSLK